MKALGILLLACVCATPVWAGWRAECRHSARECRRTRGLSIATTTTTSPLTPEPLTCNGKVISCWRWHGTAPQPDIIVCDGQDIEQVCGVPLGFLH